MKVKFVNKIKLNSSFLGGIFAAIFFLLTSVDCAQNKSLVNTSHLDHLYQKIEVNGNSMGIIHIYSDYPDYNYVGAKGEGIACVDDAARAEIFYMKYYQLHPSKEVLNKIKNLTRFLLYMQADNGFFYNFIWKDYSIDSTYKTSVAQPNWWTWRAIWTLSQAQKFFLKYDSKFASKIEPVLEKTISVTLKWLSNNNEKKYESFGGFKIPTWLPYKYAADQSAILVKGFTVYYELTKDIRVKDAIKKLCDGIIQMQAGNSNQAPYYVFLSWQNTWHEWGNSQADALIDAAGLIQNNSYIKYAGREVTYFYPYLLKEKFYNDFVLEKNDSGITMKKVNKYAQIAYGIRPMVWASLGLYKFNHDTSDAITAGKLACWLLGDNIAGIEMYNPKNGVCFDGIIGKNEVNKNSGAESTIEALLTLLEAEQNPISDKILHAYLISKN